MKILFLFCCMFSLATFASDVAQIQLPSPVKKQTSKLSQLKAAEEQEKWTECAKLASSVFAQESLVKGWVLVSWLKCSRKADGKTSTIYSKPALAAFDLQTNLRLQGAWRRRLQSEALKTRFQVISKELPTEPSVLNSNDFTRLIEMIEQDDKESISRALSMYGEWSYQQKDFEAAKSFLEQSLDLKESKNARDKYQQSLLALNVKSESQQSEQTKTEPSGSAQLEAEQKFEERFENAQKNNDLIALVEDCISYLNRFPLGVKAKWANEKVLDIYFYFLDQGKNGDQKWLVLRERTLALMEKVEWSKLSDWARLLHRRADYLGSYRLAEKTLDRVGVSAWSASLLVVAGRSAQFIGDEKTAQKYFEQYAVSYSSGEDIGEVLFRLGLVYLRRAQPASAVAIFERVISLKSQDRNELSSRYWMIRALQTLKSPRVQQESDLLMQKFPFSYFGLKLRAEMNQGVLEWPYPLEGSESLKATIKLTGPQKKSWDRFRLLAISGWREEAALESMTLAVPSDIKNKVLFAQNLAESQSYSQAIRILNQAVDRSIESRTRDVVAYGFPKEFKTRVEQEGVRNNLSPILIWSLIRQESAFNSRALSSSNAMGLMQLIPPTASEVAKNLKIVMDDVSEDSFQVDRNIQMGSQYLADMIKQFQGSVPLGLAAYNAGPGRVESFLKQRPGLKDSIVRTPTDPLDELWFDEIPWSETSFYVKAILRNSLIYRMLDERRVLFSNGFWKDLVVSPSSESAKSQTQGSSR